MSLAAIVQLRGTKFLRSHTYQGRVKVRLWHGKGLSLIIPDYFLLSGTPRVFFRPLSFLPNMVWKHDAGFTCQLAVDIEGGYTVEIRFDAHGKIGSQMPDGAEVYSCTVFGPSNLKQLATGTFDYVSQIPHLRLYHHTKIDTRILIEKSGELRASAWNFQGTHKKFRNVSYAYLSEVEQITSEHDLIKVNMSSEGKIHLLRDGFDPPTLLPGDFEERFASDMLSLKVYRESTTGRTASVPFLVSWDMVAPAYLYIHESDHVYYEVVSPHVFRIGLAPGRSLTINNGRLTASENDLVRFDYIVIGDCTTLKGLEAPYDEEDTDEVAKLERIPANTNMLAFWFDHRNSDLFSGKQLRLQEFE